MMHKIWLTLPKTNSSPLEKGWLEHYDGMSTSEKLNGLSKTLNDLSIKGPEISQKQKDIPFSHLGLINIIKNFRYLK